MKKMKTRNTTRAFAFSMMAALLTAVAVSGVLLALNRMENTMNAAPYTLFSLERRPGSHLALTALGEEYDLDFNGVRRFEQKLSRFERAAAPGTRLFLEAVSNFVNTLSRYSAP